MIDEMSRRRPSFQPGVPVTLSDGQEWHFRRPRLTVSPAMTDGQVAGVTIGAEGVADYDHLASILTGEFAVPTEAHWAARFTAAVAMLRSNYTLGDEECAELLKIVPSDLAEVERSDAIVDVFLGVSPGPKAEPVTSSGLASSAG
jgi:hypothetical protein